MISSIYKTKFFYKINENQSLSYMIIYKITNKINNKIYIGQTINSIGLRWSRHKYYSKTKKHPMYSAMRKYGVENFTIEEIGGANNITELNYQEWLLIYKFNSLWPNGYNMMEGGGNKGKMLDISKKKISKCSHRSKKVINIKDNTTWESAKKCWKENKLPISYSTFKQKLSGICGNETNFRYLESPKIKKQFIKGNSKKVLNIKTGEIYKSAKECWEKNNLKIKENSLRQKLNGHRKNNTNFRYLEIENGR